MKRPSLVLNIAAACLLAACVPRERVVRRVETTSAELPAGPPEPASSNALWLAETEIAADPTNPWAHYARAAALHALRRTDDAIAAYRDAEARFPASVWGKSIAVYGRARALDDAGRCDNARVAYGEYVALVEDSDPLAADMARRYAQLCHPSSPGDGATSEVSTAVVARDYERALALANRVPPGADTTSSPWLDYNLAVAFAELGRTVDAVASFTAAEHGFARAGDARGRAIAIYGRARALDAAGRCDAATAAYREYAAVAGDRQAAEDALGIARHCEGAP